MGIQEIMHEVFSVKLYCCSFSVRTISLDIAGNVE